VARTEAGTISADEARQQNNRRVSERDLRAALLRHYRHGQAATASGAVYTDPTVAWPYYEANYTDIIAGVPRELAVLDVGTGHGSLLAWLRSRGFSDVEGVDASPDDVLFANSHLGESVVAEGDAVEFLRARQGAYGLVFAKALVEHVPRGDLLELVGSVRDALEDGGIFIVDVPNMDWLVSGHERYMDLTHESGFTRESLSSLLSLAFDEVVVRGSLPAAPLTRAQRLLRPTLIRSIRFALYVLGEGADGVLFESRSLIAVARKESR
jgi:2-polyprenyl-3-methyl-5-hydroxy-6-metoxy-1,4-benzoquinol methylase